MKNLRARKVSGPRLDRGWNKNLHLLIPTKGLAPTHSQERMRTEIYKNYQEKNSVILFPVHKTKEGKVFVNTSEKGSTEPEAVGLEIRTFKNP